MGRARNIANLHALPPDGSGLKSTQVFTTAGSATYTKPTGIKTVRVYVTGAGAGGGSYGAANDMGAGGGAGATAIKLIDVTSISTVTVNVGAGGAGGAAAANAGTGGGGSSFGSHATGNGGSGGMHGNYGPNLLTNECDLLIAIGMRFDDRVTGDPKSYATQAKIIHLDIDPAEIDKNIKVEVPIIGDCKESLKLITDKIDKKSHSKWISKFDDLMKIEFDKVINSDLNPSKKGLTMGESIIAINEQTKGDAIIVTDVGQHQMVAHRYANFIKSKSNITSGGLGTMGFALPAAMGAKVGAMNREVVAIIGDGGYQMTIQELGTIFQLQIPVKIVILNNDFLGMVRQWQQLFFDKRYASTEMINPDFVTIAKGYYLDSERVSERKDLKPAVERMIKSKKPYVLEICVEKEDNVFPMIPSGASVSDVRLS